MVVCPKPLISSISIASISSAVFTTPRSLSLNSRIASKRFFSPGLLRKRSIIWVSCSVSEIFFFAIPSLIENDLQKVQLFLRFPSTFFPPTSPTFNYTQRREREPDAEKNRMEKPDEKVADYTRRIYIEAERD